MAISFSDIASNKARSAAQDSAAQRSAAGSTSIGNLTSTFSPSGGTDIFAPSLGDRTAPTASNDWYSGVASQIPQTFSGLDGGILVPRGSSLPSSGQVPNDRTQPTVENPFSKLAQGAQKGPAFTDLGGNAVEPRAALPNSGQVPAGRTQPTVDTDRYAPLLDQVNGGGGGFVGMDGRPLPPREGPLPNNGQVPEGRAEPSEAIDRSAPGLSPVITSSGMTYRQAGSPLMGSIDYSSTPGALQGQSSDIFSPLTGQPPGGATGYTDIYGMPVDMRGGLPNAPASLTAPIQSAVAGAARPGGGLV